MLLQRLGTVERLVGLLDANLGVADLRLHLRDRLASPWARVASIWLSCVSSMERSSVASTSPFLDRVALVGVELDHDHAVEIGADGRLLARHDGAGDGERLDEFAPFGSDDADGRRGLCRLGRGRRLGESGLWQPCGNGTGKQRREGQGSDGGASHGSRAFWIDQSGLDGAMGALLPVGRKRPVTMARAMRSMASMGMPMARQIVEGKPLTDRHEHDEDLLEIGHRLDLAAFDGGGDVDADAPLHRHHALLAGEPDGVVAHGFGADFGEQRRHVVVVAMANMRHHGLDDAVDDRRVVEHGVENLRILAAVGLGDRLDDRFLGGEIAVERTRAHAGFGADALHGGALEAGPLEAALGGIHDALGLLVTAFRTRERMALSDVADHFPGVC